MHDWFCDDMSWTCGNAILLVHCMMLELSRCQHSSTPLLSTASARQHCCEMILLPFFLSFVFTWSKLWTMKSIFFMLDCFKRTGYYKSVQCLLFFFFYLKQTNASLMYLRFNLLPEGKKREIKYPKINPHSLTTHYKNR